MWTDATSINTINTENTNMVITSNGITYPGSTMCDGYLSAAIANHELCINEARMNLGEDGIEISGRISKPNNSFTIWLKISKIEVYNDRVVKVEFEDGSYTKAVCRENDIFDLDTGLTVCIVKKLLGGQKDGTRAYNDILRNCHKIMNDQENAKVEEQLLKERLKRKRRKAELKRAAKRLGKKEELIDIQKQAYLRAMEEYESAKDDDLK